MGFGVGWLGGDFVCSCCVLYFVLWGWIVVVLFVGLVGCLGCFYCLFLCLFGCVGRGCCVVFGGCVVGVGCVFLGVVLVVGGWCCRGLDVLGNWEVDWMIRRKREGDVVVIELVLVWVREGSCFVVEEYGGRGVCLGC